MCFPSSEMLKQQSAIEVAPVNRESPKAATRGKTASVNFVTMCFVIANIITSPTKTR